MTDAHLEIAHRLQGKAGSRAAVGDTDTENLLIEAARFLRRLPTQSDEERAADEAADILRHKELRDQFAIAAIPICISYSGGNAGIIAQAAYSVADAMMKARDA